MFMDQEISATNERITRCFREIEEVRMAGIPILNPSLKVEVVGLQMFGDEWLCILITPWFMNVMLLTPSPSTSDHIEPVEPRMPTGTKQQVTFPAGRFEMICGFEPQLGTFRMCSLFSPVLEFADQESAVATANAAIESIMASSEVDAASEDPDMEMIWRGERPTEKQLEERNVSNQETQTEQATDKPETKHLDRRHLLFGASQNGRPR